MNRRVILPLVLMTFTNMTHALNEPPATVRWRAVPTGLDAGAPSIGHDHSFDELLRDLKNALGSEAEGKAKTDIAAAVNELLQSAESRPPAERQAWIENHLGELNALVRELADDAPPSLAIKAAAGAAELNNRAERWDDGRDLAEIALRRDSSHAVALISRSRANYGLKDFARAYSDADAVLSANSDASAGWTARSAASYGLGNYVQAAADARRALDLDAEDKAALVLIKLSQGHQQTAPQFDSRLPESVEREYHGMVQQVNQAETLRQLAPEQPVSRPIRRFIDTAGAKLVVKDYRGAIEEADKALALEPDNASALYYRAAAKNLLGRYNEAARDASRGLALTPSAAALRDARAWAYIRMGRFAEAIGDANHSLELDPKNPYAFANRGHAHEGRGDYESMAADLRAAAELSAQFEPDYRDSLRRHGLAPEPLQRANAQPAPRATTARARSMAVILGFSLVGGLLIGLGVLRAGSTKRAFGETPIVLAHYEIVKSIGRGGMGIVYEARDKRLNRSVAIKMLRDEFLLDDAARKGLVEEARTVAELHHPNIVDIYAVEQDERGLYLVFERLQGRTLDELIGESKRLSLSEAKRLLGFVCSALEYAHSRDVVHRDLKPENVMLTHDGTVKVLDFGISRHSSRAGRAATTTQTVVGTPHYMAPEQEYGFIRKENDIFSLGAVLYEMLTGSRPFDGTSAAKIAKTYQLPSQRVPELGPELDALIERALEPDPNQRISSAREFMRKLEAIPERAELPA